MLFAAYCCCCAKDELAFIFQFGGLPDSDHTAVETSNAVSLASLAPARPITRYS